MSICSLCASFPLVELLRQSPPHAKTALVAALDKTTHFYQTV